MLSERLKKWAPRVGFPAFYLFSFVLFASFLFPYDKLRDNLVATFNAQQRATGSPQELSIDEMGWYWFSGVRAKGIKLTSASPDPKKPPAEINIDEAHGRLSVLGLLVGNRDVTFHLDALGGAVDGSFDQHGKDRAVEVVLDGVDLSKVDTITQLIGLPVEGKISGSVKFSLPEGKASKGNGVVTLDAQNVAIGDGKAKLKDALPWPKMNVGALSITAEAKDGVLKVTKLAAGGKDIEVQGEGKVQMRELANESGLDVYVRFKVNDGYRGQSDMTKSLFGAPGSPKGGDVELFVPQMKQAKRPDGMYSFHVRGLLGRPDFDPAPNASGGTGGGAASGGGGFAVPLPLVDKPKINP